MVLSVGSVTICRALSTADRISFSTAFSIFLRRSLSAAIFPRSEVKGSFALVSWPLMVFLHGAGERGSDLKKVKVHGPPKIVENKKDFPFILVSPQCPEDVWWPEKVEVLIALVDDITGRYKVDKKRIYLTGLSMGGYGTWALAAQYPDRFAAIAPICGGGSRVMSFNLKDVPIWVFHGAKDRVVPIKESEEMVKAIRKLGGDVKFTIYPDAGHDSWTETYNNQELYDWFLEHRKK